MSVFIIIGLAIAVAVGLAVLKARGLGTAKGGQGIEEESVTVSFPYCRTASLLTPAELSFFNVLLLALGNDLRVMVKPRLGDLVEPTSGIGRGERQSALNRINQKHVDFVVCDRACVPRFVIELDDISHGRSDRAKRDGFVDGVFKAAGIPIFHQPAKADYAVESLRQMIASANASDAS